MTLRVDRCGPDGWHWAVFDGDQKISGAWSHRTFALEQLDRIERRRSVTERPCMCCGKTFKSEGIHNRMCAVCRGLSDGGSFTMVAAQQSGRGRKG